MNIIIAGSALLGVAAFQICGCLFYIANAGKPRSAEPVSGGIVSLTVLFQLIFAAVMVWGAIIVFEGLKR